MSNDAVMKASRISVVLPNFNHGHLVEGALRALLTQSLPPSEIIVVDDASTDNSRSVIERMDHPTIRLLVNPKNLGVIRSLNRGLELVTGGYIYLAAADDLVGPGFFALAIKTLEQYPQAGLFCADAVLIDGESGRFRGYRPIVRPFYRTSAAESAEASHMLRRFDNWILTCSTVFRSDAWRAAGGLDETCGSFADGYLTRKIALMHGFCYSPRVVATWRIFSSGVSRQTSLNLEKATEILETIPARIARDPIFPPWYARVFQDRWRFAAARLAVEATPINYAVLDSMTATSALDNRMLKLNRQALSRHPAAERLVTLAWLAARLWPYPLSRLIATRLSRWFGVRG
jgi:glycosyltransferase involved in cell wall biosynthesis